MKDSILEKYAPTKQFELPATLSVEADGHDDIGPFGFLRGIHERAIMLEVRCKDGTAHAFGYAWLNRARYDPSEGITLQFGSETVKITGRNLNKQTESNVGLFAGIVRHRVPWIQEADQPTILEAGPGQVVIERIEIDG